MILDFAAHGERTHRIGHHRRGSPEPNRRLIKDRLAKARHEVAHFVADRRRGSVELRALPQQDDLRVQLALDRRRQCGEADA